MKIYFSILFLSVLFYSCSQRNHIPSGIIKPFQMQEILWDMLRADILAQELVKKEPGKNIETESKILNEKIFSIHKTSHSEFENSLKFYQQNPGLMKTIFDSINAQQSKRKYRRFESKSQNLKIKKPIQIKTKNE